MLEPLFRSDGRRYRPSEHSRGPWDDRALHGGPVAALIGRALEQLPSDSPVQVARFTMEILRPVPLAPLEVATRIARPGRRVQLVSATVTAGDTEVCTASAWRMRTQAMNLGAQREAGDGDIPPPTAGSPGQDPAWGAAFHSTGVEMSFVRGHFVEPGAATVWIRLRGPVVDDEPPSPLMRVLAAADFGNGVSAELDWNVALFINTELTVHLFREPAGEWICLDARTHVGERGVGVAECGLHDEHGGIGRSAQALFVDTRSG